MHITPPPPQTLSQQLRMRSAVINNGCALTTMRNSIARLLLEAAEEIDHLRAVQAGAPRSSGDSREHRQGATP